MNSSLKLSICLPSHGAMNVARQTIENIEDLSRKEGIEAIISDNSRDEQKLDFIRPRISNSFRYDISSETGMLKNWLNSSSSARGEFLCIVSDDDLLIPLPGFSCDSLVMESGSVGLRPQMAMYTEERGIYSLTGFSIDANTAVDRIKQYFRLNGGANTTLFSLYSRNYWRSLHEDICDMHPTLGGFSDWSIVLGLLAGGRLISYPKLLYIYNNKNWASEQLIATNLIRTFIDAGLDAETAYIAPIIQGLDSFGTVGRANLNIDPREKYEASFYVLREYAESFIRSIDVGSVGKDPVIGERLRKSRSILSMVQNEVDLLAACLIILEEWQPGYSEKYRVYFIRMLDKIFHPMF